MSHVDDFRFGRRLVTSGGRHPDSFYRHGQGPLGQPYEPEPGCEPEFDQLIDAEHLMRTFERMKSSREKAPGPDGIRFGDLGRTEIPAAMRDLSRRLRDGTWTPGHSRTVRIPKKSKGTRPLRLRSIFSRVVSKVLHDALQDFWDARLLDGCVAYRPGRSPHRMLAEMLWWMKTTDCWVIAQADIKDAFECVDVGAVIRIHREQLSDERLFALIETLLRTDLSGRCARVQGVDQECAYSVHTLNARLNEIHDENVKDDVPGWWRYSDDLAYVTGSVSEGRTILRRVEDLLGPSEFSLKDQEDADEPVSDLQRGDTTNLLGLSISLCGNRLRFSPGPETWTGLRKNIHEAHASGDPPESALRCVSGWINAIGPAFENAARSALLREVRTVLRDHGFRDCADASFLMGQAIRAHRRWRSLLREAKPSNRGQRWSGRRSAHANSPGERH